MKIGRALIFLGCLISFSCGDENATSERLASDAANNKDALIVSTIENLDYTDYALSSASEEAVVDWEAYKELALQISYLKKADLSFFNGEKKVIKTFTEEFITTVPEQLQTNPILSRSAIVETELLKLNENLTLDNIDRATKVANVKALLEAFSNLNYQINKKMEFDIYDNIVPE